MTTLAETILRDVPRFDIYEGDILFSAQGTWVTHREVLSALTAAMDPAAPDLKRIGTGLYETQSDYRLAPHLQRIVDAAKSAPQWDTQADRLAPTDAAQARECAECGERDPRWQSACPLSYCPHVNETPKSEHDAGNVLTAAQAREAALLHPDAMLPEAIRLIRQEATRDHSQEVVTGLKHIALLLEQLTGEART